MKRVLFSFLCLSVMFSSVCFGEVVIKDAYASKCVQLFDEAISKVVILEKLHSKEEYRKYVNNFSSYDETSDRATMQCARENLWVLVDELYEINTNLGMKYLDQVGRIGL